MARFLVIVFLCAPLAGCYYMQAASGQWEVVRNRESLEEVIAAPGTPPELADRLRLLDEARDFSVTDLGLPDNKSYRTFSELERDYVVWNVFAAPEFSLEPKVWCFPVAGCVSYRGYFSKDSALKKAQRLKKEGYDVAVGGVAAYSTLGKFNDPILSTMMRWDDTDLIAVLFHELAHQVVYVKDDSAFNESFATAVEEFGVQRWLESRGESDQMQEYNESRKLQRRLMVLVQTAREALEPVYKSDIQDAEKRSLKQEQMQILATSIAEELQQSGRGGSNWLSGELNNARLISTALYEGWLPSFRALYIRCEKEMDCFYAEVRKLADMEFSTREAVLSAGDLLRFEGGANEQ